MTSFADPGSVQSAGDETRDVQVNLNADVSGYTAQVGAAQQQTAALGGSVDKLSASMSGLAKAAGRQLFHFAAADFAVLSAATASAALLEHQLSTLRATSAVTGTSMSSMKDQLDATFTQFPVARREVVQLYETINNLGVSAPKAVGSAANTFLKLGAATGESSAGLASGNLQLNRQMGNTDPGQVAGYANSLLTVSKMQGVAASGVLDFAQNIAPMARAAGIGEAAVLGISAAFQKAGADGGYAANTFNKIVTEIATLKQTGSPELAKYASFVGKGTKEFAAQSGTEQATQVFSGIGKGGPEALNFMSSIGLGPRDLRAVQAVAQSGSMGQAIAQSVGASTNTKNLDTASEAALHGLTDSLIEIGNKFVQLGEIVGGPLLKPLTMLADVLGLGLTLINKVVSALGPLPAIIGTLAGALAIPAGMALTHMGAIGALAMGRTMFGSQSAPRVAMAEGRAAGAAIRGGALPATAMMAGPVGQRIAAGRDPMNPLPPAGLRYTQPYAMGMAAGQRGPGGFEQRYGMTPMGAVRAGAGRGMGGVLGAGTWMMTSQSDMLRRSSMSAAERMAAPSGPGFITSVREGSLRGAARAGAGLVADTARAGGSMAAAATGRAASLAAAGIGVPTGSRVPVPPVAAAAPAAAAAAPAAGMLARASGALFSPIGMIATMVAVPLISSVVDSIKEGNAAKADVSGSLSGAVKYDQALDQSSSNLARFGDSVDTAADRLNKFANQPIKDLGTVSGEDINAVSTSGYEISDPNLRAVIEQATAEQAKPGADQSIVKNAIGAYLGSIGGQAGSVDGARFTKIKQDVLSVMGTGQASTVSDIMNAYGAQPGGVGSTPMDYGNLASLAQTTGDSKDFNQDINDPANIEDFKSIFGTGISGLVAGTQSSGDEGTKSRVAIALSMAAKGTGRADPGQQDRINAVKTYLAESTGVDAGQLGGGMQPASADFGAGTSFQNGEVTQQALFGNEKDALSVWVRSYANSDQGKAFLQRNNMTEEDLYNSALNPAALPPPSASDTAKSLRASGPLGTWAAGSDAFQQASTGIQSGQPVPGMLAAKQLTGEAVREAGGDLPAAGANLMALADKIGGATGALIRSAAAWADHLQELKLPTLSREDQLETVTRDARVANAALTTDSSPEAKERAVAKTTAAENAIESQRQYMISRIIQIKAFNVQQERAQEDQNLSIFNSNRDFATQQERAEYSYGVSRARSEEDFGVQQERAQNDQNLQVQRSQEDFRIQRVRGEHDYYLQVLRAQEDYQTSARRSLADYQLNVNRQQADHARDLKRQAAAAAQDIYDPFIRIQTKAVTDAGTLIYNLKEQNADIERQIQQIQELKDRGLSQDAIDTLKLSDASNAQQVRALVMSLDQNPDMVGQINEQIGRRRAGTAQLTQSDNNVNFRQSQEDFAQAMSRASEDFSTMQQRAAEDQGKTMQRMSDDFATSQQRAADDQSKTLDRMATDFATSQTRAADDNGKSLQRMFTDFAQNQAWAVADHARALGDMAIAFKTQQDRAAQDLLTSFAQYTGDFASVVNQLSTTALGAIQKFAPAAGNTIIAEINRVHAALPLLTNPAGIDPATGNKWDRRGLLPGTRYAYGGISLTQQEALVSEHGPELHLPLNSRGENFMAGLIARAMVQGVTTATNAMPSSNSTSNSSDNRISFAGAEITVSASDPNAMARELAAKAKLARLASPVRH